MYVCAGRYGREEEGREAEGEGVTHGVDEYVGHEKTEGIIGENERAERLAQ